MYYKLTDQNLQAYNGFQWELNEWYEIPEKKQGGGLCSPSFFHCYNHPALAIILNPIHANFDNPRLFEIEVGGKNKDDYGVKFGFTRMKLVKEIELPNISTMQKVEFAIRCAMMVYKEKVWTEWANDWLNNKNRTSKSAANSAAYAGRSADDAARAAAYAADSAAAAAYDAAAYAVAYAANAAAYTVAANAANDDFNFIEIIEEITM